MNAPRERQGLVSRKRVLWLRKKPTGNNGGDEIFESCIVSCLQRETHVDILEFTAVSRVRQALNLLFGVPPGRFRYKGGEPLAEHKELLIAADRALVVSWENLDFFRPPAGRSISIVVHNVLSDASRDVFGYGILGWVLSLWLRSWEARVYRAPWVANLFSLSRRDQHLLTSLTGKSVVYLPPGMPPPLALLSNATIDRSLVIAGSYDWFPKRRDLRLFQKEYLAQEHRVAVMVDEAAMPYLSGVSLGSSSFSGSEDRIAFGLITDRFLAGFKLKSLWYISRNMVVVSLSDVRPEYAHIPGFDEFIHFAPTVSHAVSLVSEYHSAEDGRAELIQRFRRFKERCVEEFSWAGSAGKLLQGLGS